VLSQLFSFPVVVLKDKAYVGGKGIENTGGNLVDYLMANEITRNALLVEIKTPMTPTARRAVSWHPQRRFGLSGAVQQSTTTDNQLIQNYYALSQSSTLKFHAFSPPSLVIVGNTAEFDDAEKFNASTFTEMDLRDIQVITFDELFTKLRTLVTLLEGVTQETLPDVQFGRHSIPEQR